MASSRQQHLRLHPSLRLHRLIDRFADVSPLGKIEQVAEPGLPREIENSPCLVIGFADHLAPLDWGIFFFPD
jgi:hypothetical protein